MTERFRKEPLRWRPICDGYGIIGYEWHCKCGTVTRFTSGGDLCGGCDFLIPDDPDPDDWYEEQMKKPDDEKDWNLIKRLEHGR